MTARASTTWAVILAAGSGTRMGGDRPKQFLTLDGAPLFWRSAETFSHIPDLAGIVFVFPPAMLDESARMVEELTASRPLGLPWLTTAGGERRQDSVANGLAALPKECGRVLIHDSARPFFSAGLATRLIDALDEETPAAIPAVAVTDTIKECESGCVTRTLDRSRLVSVQTPQAFLRDVLEAAHALAVEKSLQATDDASLVEALGRPVAIVDGEQANVKITNPEDVRLLQKEAAMIPVTGFGYDVHKYGSGRPMVLGGVPIQGGPEVVAHSDGDVVLHALTDALLGCMGGGDIGQRFPDNDPRFEGMESSFFLREVLEDVRRTGIEIVHADLTIIAQIPKVGPHRERIAKNIAALLALPPERVAVKATTEEGLGFTGQKLGIKSVAVVSAIRRS
ncbi:2-C-methyl-D-erythritol 4-phosphate cytidylyltransferase [Oceanidesulfovibrio marinus]|uniref:Bifunctional enzyme IspD/IspF n=1 Tax=Oceanidesulfovibrio marinus TaxID=370038 RepID=A0ABX6NCE0_9BACT|nr:2-C-methyl-D-erythritol 4-phosphate cytidylyltransferase [Oceanidesulfovibrio marinus]QJT08266.1 2-C-methyl-D-erythritol 4-phosphate cytidylyltransferase [Oceanidesulfovibrio marinus]